MFDSERVVIDTSTFVSRLFFTTSVPAMAVEKALSSLQLIESVETLEELRSVVTRRKFDGFLPLRDRMDFYYSVEAAAIHVSSVVPVSACRDPRDDKFLALAVTGKASLILTGDHDLLALHPFRGIDILTPRQYLDRG